MADSEPPTRPHRDLPSIPAPAVKRLCLYLRELEALTEAGRNTVSSKQLGQLLGLTDAQVRKDLAYFGQFGQPGIGYDVNQLMTELRRVLGTDKGWNACLVGAGNLGRALLAHAGFERKGFRIMAVLDASPRLQNEYIHGLRIRSMDELDETVRELETRLGIIAVPASSAQDVCDRLVAAGVRGIMNFAPKRLQVSGDVSIVSVDLAVQLEQLAFQVSLGRRSGATPSD